MTDVELTAVREAHRFDEAKRQSHQGAQNQDAQHYEIAESNAHLFHLRSPQYPERDIAGSFEEFNNVVEFSRLL